MHTSLRVLCMWQLDVDGDGEVTFAEMLKLMFRYRPHPLIPHSHWPHILHHTYLHTSYPTCHLRHANANEIEVMLSWVAPEPVSEHRVASGPALCFDAVAYAPVLAFACCLRCCYFRPGCSQFNIPHLYAQITLPPLNLAPSFASLPYASPSRVQEPEPEPKAELSKEAKAQVLLLWLLVAAILARLFSQFASSPPLSSHVLVFFHFIPYRRIHSLDRATLPPPSFSIAQINQIFKLYDKDKSGTLTVSELRKALEKTGIEPDEIQSLFKE